MLAIAIFIYNNKTINDSRYIENVRSVIISFPWERNVVEQWQDFEFQTLQNIFSISLKVKRLYFSYNIRW
jgi:hypothetical protein